MAKRKQQNDEELTTADPSAAAALLDEPNNAEDSQSQYVTFYIGEECLAFPMQSVLEIIRVPETVTVPLTPPGLVGLANLRGRVLPVLDMRRLLGMPEREYNDATRVVVADCGSSVGLVVDRVSRVLNVEQDKIEDTKAVQSSIDSTLLTGVVKNVAGHSLIQLLDVQAIVSVEFTSVIESQKRDQASNAVEDQLLASETDEEESDDASQVVSFLVEGQEYAFEISHVEEIVRVPSDICHVPKSGAHVLGLMNLRDRLLPLVSLRRMFHLTDAPLGDHTRVVVVSPGRHQGGQDSVGIVVDQVREVLRVPLDVQDTLPTLLRQGGDLQEVSAVCRLNEGKRLLSVLSADALFHSREVQAALEESREQVREEDREMSHDGESLEATEDDEIQIVVFQLANEEYGVMIDAVQEIIRVPDEMSKVPKTPVFVEGMINLRGSVLPVLDMRTRFELQRAERSDRQRILVLNLEGVRTGFIVDAVAEVLRLSRSVIESSPSLSADQTRIMGRVANLKTQKRMILVLDTDQLVDSRSMRQLTKASA